MERTLKDRKRVRLLKRDYSTPGFYFVTICVKNRKNLLSRIVGTGVPDGPSGDRSYRIALFEKGEIAERILRQMSDFYDHLSVDAYVIMPNHIHFLLQIHSTESEEDDGGPSGTPVPTRNSVLSRFVSTFKRFCNKEYGENIWQGRSHDHIIRSREDYEEHLRYIESNPQNWSRDELFVAV